MSKVLDMLFLNKALVRVEFESCFACRSSDDPCTLTTYPHGNVPGVPARIRSMCSQKMLTTQRVSEQTSTS